PAVPTDLADMQVTVATLVYPPPVRRTGDPVERVEEPDLLSVILGCERVGQRLDRRGLNTQRGGHGPGPSCSVPHPHVEPPGQDSTARAKKFAQPLASPAFKHRESRVQAH